MYISVMREENKIYVDTKVVNSSALRIPTDINYISYKNGEYLIEKSDGSRSTEHHPFIDDVIAYVSYVPVLYYDADRNEYKTSYEDQTVPEWGLLECPPQPDPTYADLRLSKYPTCGEQFDMQYHDMQNGTTVWKDTIAAIKAKYPKP